MTLLSQCLAIGACYEDESNNECSKHSLYCMRAKNLEKFRLGDKVTMQLLASYCSEIVIEIFVIQFLLVIPFFNHQHSVQLKFSGFENMKQD